ncbi:60S ribosomal protein L7-like 1 [Babesia sp. Xinjiang]|uniref:60S ribosomal protein L7-like 1 n=1 Tax=Babesia sp. Xinjiang TaxID=462227 RepID=UPI000A226C68|nr:60S ribosomal protein L7-like 1 [Babesia sp. Xinjiang]ORM40493.1 60S ribosomal protein L7-like 1 [Babesia sp. Xinjiang]
MEEIRNDTKKKETLLKGHRFHLNKRSEIAKEFARLKSQNKIKRDINTIVSLQSLHKKSVRRSLDIKRTTALNKKKTISAVKTYKLLLAVRNRRAVESSISRSTLQLMGLLRIGTGRFFSNSEQSLKDLLQVEPFVFFGTPTLKHVRELLHKRGTTILPGGKTMLISSNSVVEDHIGGTDLLCLDDVVDAVYNGTDAAEDILQKLGTIQMPRTIVDGLAAHFHALLLLLYSPLKHGDIGSSINNMLDHLM